MSLGSMRDSGRAAEVVTPLREAETLMGSLSGDSVEGVPDSIPAGERERPGGSAEAEQVAPVVETRGLDGRGLRSKE